jgi:putative SOS response-associated peptidase YedK
MCNHYSSSGAWRDQMGEFSQLRLPAFDADRARPNVQGPDIWPAYTGEILRIEEDRLIAEAATWLFVPFWFKKPFAEWRKTNGGCNNAKGETAETSGVFKHAAKTGRCLIPGEAFFEYGKERGADGKKPEYRFSYPDGRSFFFAGLRSHVDLPDKGPILTYTMVTKPPGPDVQSIGHHRQPVILEPDELAAWLDPANPIAGFLDPSPAGTFNVNLARGVPA